MHVNSKAEIGVQSYEGCCLALQSTGACSGSGAVAPSCGDTIVQKEDLSTGLEGAPRAAVIDGLMKSYCLWKVRIMVAQRHFLG
jgi:uncharacterized protein (DUF779 family)